MGQLQTQAVSVHLNSAQVQKVVGGMQQLESGLTRDRTIDIVYVKTYTISNIYERTNINRLQMGHTRLVGGRL